MADPGEPAAPWPRDEAAAWQRHEALEAHADASAAAQRERAAATGYYDVGFAFGKGGNRLQSAGPLAAAPRHSYRRLEVAPHGEVLADFRAAVNMAPAELEAWLATDAAWAAGAFPRGRDESTSHLAGRRTAALLRRHGGARAFSPREIEHMRQTVAAVHRHLARPPGEDAGTQARERWAAALKNWGHDPDKPAPRA